MNEYIYNFFSPLSNFETEEPEIKINDDLKINIASDYDKETLTFLKQKWTNIIFSDYLLRAQIKKDIPETEPNLFLEDARRQIENVITILRLFKEESVGFNIIIQQYSDKPGYAYSANALFHYMLWTPPQSNLLNRTYELKNEETQEYIPFFSEYNLPSLSPLQLAIIYFNKSYIEPYPYRDSFLDCMIALESLFLKSTSQELGYKLRVRMAHLLGHDIKERTEIYEFMKGAYSLRSKIVHGEKTKGLDDNNLLKTRNLLRESLKYFIKNLQVWSGDKLDSIVLNETFFPNHSVE